MLVTNRKADSTPARHGPVTPNKPLVMSFKSRGKHRNWFSFKRVKL